MFHLEMFQIFVTARNTVFLVEANTYFTIINTKNLHLLKKRLQSIGNQWKHADSIAIKDKMSLNSIWI